MPRRRHCMYAPRLCSASPRGYQHPPAPTTSHGRPHRCKVQTTGGPMEAVMFVSVSTASAGSSAELGPTTTVKSSPVLGQ
jgi:hypothetical protein